MQGLKIDTATLERLITRLFELKWDGSLSPDQQARAKALAHKGRGVLVGALSTTFKEGDTILKQANSELKTVTDRIDEDIKVIANVNKTLDKIAEILGALDKLLENATNFL